jgi:acyl-CoA synthetase (AMP-forming)/AMP-acid ligase II
MRPVPIQLNHRPLNLLQQIDHLLHEHGNDPCVVIINHDHEYTLTYAQFFERAAHFATLLAGAGISAGDLVVLVLQHGEAVMCGFWGAIMLGAVPSIFSFLSDKQDSGRYFHSVRKLVEHEGVKAIITSAEFEQPLRDILAGLSTTLLTLNMLKPNETTSASMLQPDRVQPGDTAFLQHSSGSTGLQKGIMLSHQSVINQIASYSAAIQLSPDDVIVTWLPLYHDMGLIAGFIMPILQGIKLVIMSPFHWVRDPKILLHAIHKHSGTLCWLPNFAYNFLATRIPDSTLNGLDLASMRAFINCSEPVYADSHHKFVERFKPYGLRSDALTVCYAMAENTFAVTQTDISSPVKLDIIDRRILMDERRAVLTTDNAVPQTIVSCGTPIANCDIRVLDDKHIPLPERCVGEIALRSDSMLTAYYHSPEITRQAILDGWYLTGDMGYLADDELYITGRKKDLIIVGGKNVYPQDIENLLNEIKGIHPGRTAVFGILDERLGTEEIAVVVEVDTEDETVQGTIKREIRARIAQNTDVTARYVHLVGAKWIIKTSSGKVARAANREKFIQEVLSF